MFKATKKIADYFKQAGVPYAVEDGREESAVVAEISGVYVGGSKARFVSCDDENDVTVTVRDFISLSETQRANIYQTLNELNGMFRYLRFRMDKDGHLLAEYDLPTSSANIAEQAFELFLTIMDVLDDAAKVILRNK